MPRDASQLHAPREYFERENEVHFDHRFELHSTLSQTKHRVALQAWDKQTENLVTIQAAVGLSPGSIVRLQYDFDAIRVHECPSLYESVGSVFGEDSAIVFDKYVEGISLLSSVAQQPFELAKAIDVAIAVFGALDVMHAAGVYHLDLRPGRIVFGHDGSIKLLRKDISLRDFSDDRAHRIQSVLYCSPEQSGSIERDINAPADLYSAGGILFFMLTGKPPYTGTEVSSVLLAHMTEPIPSLQDSGVSVPCALESVIHRLLDKDPSNRYQTAEAVLYDLSQIKAQLDAGKSEPELVIGSRDDRATLIEPSFVGRANEMNELTQALRSVAGGRSQIVSLEGISGAGKSRLLLEISQRAVRMGFRLFRGQGLKGTSRGLSIFDGTVEDVLAAAANEPEFRDQLLARIETELGCLTSVFPTLKTLQDSDSPKTAPGNLNEQRVARALSKYLNSLGSKSNPALVILDDCQWADSQTYATLQRWIIDRDRSDSHVLVLVASRSEEISATHPLRRLNAMQVALGHLSEAEVFLLAESMAGALPKEALEFIANGANGSPFMASAAVRGLVESDAISRTPEGWRINRKAFDACQSSTDAGEFLGRRLDLLSEPTLQFLSTASIIGKAFDLDVACDLTGFDGSSAIGALEEARSRNMVWLRGKQDACVFSHDKIRETLQDKMSPDQKREIHRRAAEYFSECAAPDAVQIAFHFDASGAPELALPYALAAAEEAEVKGALDTARELYSIAVRATDVAGATDPKTVHEIHYGLGRVLMFLGEYEASEAQLRLGANFTSNATEEARIQESLAKLSFKRGELETSLRHYEDATRTLNYAIPTNRFWRLANLAWEGAVYLTVQTFPGLLRHRVERPLSEQERLTMKVLSGITHTYWYSRGKTDVFLMHLREMNLGEKFLPSAELAVAYAEHAPGMSLFGLHDRGIRFSDRAIKQSRASADLCAQGEALSFKAVALYCGSRFEEAISAAQEAARLIENSGDYWTLHMAGYQEAMSYYRLGRFREAAEVCEATYESALAVGDKQSMGEITHVWAEATYGNLPNDYLDREVDVEAIDAQTGCEVAIAKGIVKLRERKFQLAIERFDEGIAMLSQAGVQSGYTAPVYFWRTHALRRLAETQVQAVDAGDRASTLKKAASAGLWALRKTWTTQLESPRIYRELALVRYLSLIHI